MIAILIAALLGLCISLVAAVKEKKRRPGGLIQGIGSGKLDLTFEYLMTVLLHLLPVSSSSVQWPTLLCRRIYCFCCSCVCVAFFS